MARPRSFATLALLALALGVCVLASEVVLRIALDPIDFLKPVRERGEILPHVIRPGSGGHDDWGFRNREVPEQVALLAIGDSMTYGMSAPREGTWPAQLGRRRDHTVYILALGGYGPAEYLHLLERFGPSLAPREVVIGLYLGNDLADTWQVLGGTRKKFSKRPPESRPFGRPRAWLARNSMLYQVAKAAMPGLSLRARENLAGVEASEDLIALEAGELRTTFLPEVTLARLDLEREEVRRGLDGALGLLDQMDGRCRELPARCLVALIPTKESVFVDVAEQSLPREEHQRTRDVAVAEDRVRAAIQHHLRRWCMNRRIEALRGPGRVGARWATILA
jgi:hypothetical protein